MLVTKKNKHHRKIYRLCKHKTLGKISLYQFPVVKGLEDISGLLNGVKAESLFSALMHAFRLRPIENETDAQQAERVLEYLERAFEVDPPQEIEDYKQVLLVLVNAYDEKQHIPPSDSLSPAEFLRALLNEEGLNQKDLVPDCFKSASQVSEFLHQKTGRKKLSYEQAVALGNRFSVNPINFLRL